MVRSMLEFMFWLALVALGLGGVALIIGKDQYL